MLAWMYKGIRQESRDVQERNPRQVLEQRGKERAVPEAILEKSVPDVSSTREDDRAREPDLETVQVETVDGELPTEQDIVDDRSSDRSSEAVCEADCVSGHTPKGNRDYTYSTKTCMPA